MKWPHICSTNWYVRKLVIVKSGGEHFFSPGCGCFIYRRCKLYSCSCLCFFFLFITVFVGYQCKVSITFCHCEKEFYQLLRLGLWAATPTCPTLAFSLEFMELTHTLNLECWVALKDRSSAIQFLEVNTISTEVST